MRLTRSVTTLALLLLSGCSGSVSPQAEVPTPACSPSSSALALEDSDGVTFYGDLLPVLSSNKSGEVYKCTTCHAHYGKPDGMNNVRELERVVESMRSGRMPRGGDRVPAALIELFSMWRLQGFKDGVIRKEAANSSDATVHSSAKGCLP